MLCAVTGANGFVGSHLVQRLEQEGHRVKVLVRPTADLTWLHGSSAERVQGDLEDQAALRRVFSGCDWVFHLAGLTSTVSRDDFFRVNAEGARTAAEACLEAAPGVRRFVLMSTLAAMGPGREGRPLSESDESRPVNWYGESKLEGERQVRALAPELPWSIVRPGAVYGPRDSDNLPLMRLAAKGLRLTVGLSRRLVNFCHVDDVVSCTLLAAEKEPALGEAFLVGDAENYTLSAAGKIMVQALHGGEGLPLWLPVSVAYGAGALGGLAARFRRGRPTLTLDRVRLFLGRNWAVDVSKARQLLGYQPRVDLGSGVARTYAWYREQGWVR
jgi:nucleoside-diphosphate-sugar epimerase